ncbi:MAG TPA: pyridoxal phosphate-dependent aminotransferase [Candidatus Saccharimonadales bacterium]|nr:pyridoxal phosphate-dependent aminotransferase [Candidatus Saccharimonadales bacterium]
MILNAIKQMERYARNTSDVISLSQGIPFLNSDNSIREAVVNALLHNNVDAYSDPQGLLILREKISEMLYMDNMNYSEGEIIVSAGATEALMATFLSLITSQKNEVLIPTPTYSAYFRIAENAKGKIIPVPLTEKEGWKLDINFLKKKITTDTSIILLCNPNNPTGSIYSKEELLEVCLLAKKNDAVVVLDEVYGEMLFDNNKIYTPCVLSELKANIIRVVSFSKDFSLTGWRVAFLHSDKRIIQKIIPVHDAIINCAPVISQYAALAAIENRDRILSANEIIYTQQRDIMKSYLDDLKPFLEYSMPKGAYFFFPKFIKKQNVEDFCFRLLKKGHVAIVPGTDFGPGGEDHIRLCFGREKEDIIKGMERLSKYLYNSRL